MKNLVIPLFSSFTGTLVLLFFNKRSHALMGSLFTALTLLHLMKHRKIMQKNLSKECLALNFFNSFNIPTSKMDVILRNVKIVHYIPGRLRLHCPNLVNNADVSVLITNHLQTIREIHDFKLNILTGSILLQYDPALVSQNSDLLKIHQLLLKNYSRR